MTTGDLKNNLRKLVSELKLVHHPQAELDIKGIAQGTPQASLPIVHHVFLDYSYSLAQHFASRGYELYGKTDLRFMEAVYKVLRDEFGYKPQLTKDQFLSIGFAERKIIFLCYVLKLLRDKHNELNPKAAGNYKPEKKKGKSLLPGSKSNSGESFKSAKENSKTGTTGAEKFPGPLPVNTDMKSFKSNQEALQAGLGLTEPLVTRMVDDDDDDDTVSCEKVDGQKIVTSGGTCNWKSIGSSVEYSVPSNLIVKTTGADQSLFGVKFPVSQNSEVRANLSKQSHSKTVTWEDEMLEVQSKQSEALPSKTAIQALPLTNEPVNPISVPTRIHLNRYVKSPAYHPQQQTNSTSIATVIHTIPSPIAMTTVPRPSPDLMLTPSVKVAHPMPIPLSNPRYRQESHGIPLVDLTDAKLPPARVIRHSSVPDNEARENRGASPATSQQENDQVYLLRQQLQELQEKFDGIVLFNNELSARVVLLESRMKLLEGASQRNECGNCGKPSGLTAGFKSLSQFEQRVVVGFEGPKTASDSVHGSILTSHTRPYLNSNNHQSPRKQSSSSRKLFKEGSTSHADPISSMDKNSRNVSSPVNSEKSDDDVDNSGVEFQLELIKSPITVASPSYAVSAISPLPTTPEISRAFTDSTTKNTVLNVHKRLQETRELLTRTNKDFAEKFNHYQ